MVTHSTVAACFVTGTHSVWESYSVYLWQSQVALQLPANCVHVHIFENDTTLTDFQPDSTEVIQRFNEAQ